MDFLDATMGLERLLFSAGPQYLSPPHKQGLPLTECDPLGLNHDLKLVL